MDEENSVKSGVVVSVCDENCTCDDCLESNNPFDCECGGEEENLYDY